MSAYMKQVNWLLQGAGSLISCQQLCSVSRISPFCGTRRSTIPFLYGPFWRSQRRRPPLWSSGQSSWLQIQRSGFDFRHYKVFWEVVVLERGPLKLVSTIEELLGRKRSGSCLENRDYNRRWSAALSTRHPSIHNKLSLTSPTSGGLPVGIARSRTYST
jgi:hypothetical protein